MYFMILIVECVFNHVWLIYGNDYITSNLCDVILNGMRFYSWNQIYVNVNEDVSMHLCVYVWNIRLIGYVELLARLL